MDSVIFRETLAVISITLITFLSACTPPKKPKRTEYPIPEGAQVVEGITPGRYGNLFTEAQLSPPKTLNPLVVSDVYSSYALQKISGSLLDYHPIKQAFEGTLAKDWEVSADNKTYTFHLRKGIYWSDGAPFSADDVLFTFDCILDKRYPNRSQHEYTFDGKPLEYEKKDDHTVVLTTPKLYAPFLMLLSTTTLLPKHILLPDYIQGTLLQRWHVGEILKNPKAIPSLGPFVIEQFHVAERMLFTPNPHYWKVDINGKRLPYLDYYIQQYAPDPNTAMMLFMSGDVDNSLDFGALSNVWASKKAKQGNYTVYERGPSTAMSFLYFNLKPGTNAAGKPYVLPYKLKWFALRDFRKAISLAIDREGIIDSLYLGKGEAMYGSISPANKKWYNPLISPHTYSPQKALALLKKNGFWQDAEGVLHDSAGNPTQFTLLTTEGGSSSSAILNIIRENLKAIGINMRVSYMDFSALIDTTMNSQEYEAASFGITGTIGDPGLGKALYKSDGHMHVWNPLQESPNTPWEARLDLLMQQQEETLNEEARIQIFHEIDSIFAEEVPLILYPAPYEYVGIRNGWHNIELPPSSYPISWNIETLWK